MTAAMTLHSPIQPYCPPTDNGGVANNCGCASRRKTHERGVFGPCIGLPPVNAAGYAARRRVYSSAIVPADGHLRSYCGQCLLPLATHDNGTTLERTWAGVLSCKLGHCMDAVDDRVSPQRLSQPTTANGTARRQHTQRRHERPVQRAQSVQGSVKATGSSHWQDFSTIDSVWATFNREDLRWAE
jgi:hypothetical protein